MIHYSNRPACWLSVVVPTVCLATCLDGRVFAQAPIQPPRIRLVFDEQLMTDPVRAQVYDVIAQSVPESEWPTLQITDPTNIPALLNDYFDIYSNGAGAAPRTQRLMTAMVENANAAPDEGVLAAGEIKVPPVPVRAYSHYAKDEVTTRRFDPESMSYELRSPSGTVERRVDEIAPAASNGIARRGRITEVVVSLTDAVRDRLRRYGTALQHVLAIDDSQGDIATMQLLSDQPAATCDSAAKWLPGSPYHSSMQLTLTAAEIAKMKSAAGLVPLTVVDWNVGVPNGHGAKVRAVVTEALHNLGLAALDAHVSTIELNPVRNRAGLKSMLAGYKKKLSSPSGSDIAKAFETAEKWVDTHVPADPDSLTQRVPSLVLQAIFWDQFRKTQAINFSFTTDSAALTVLDSNFMIGAKAFGALAAGNSGMPASPALKPQAEAYQWPNVVNVTHGRIDGAIDGDVTNPQHKIVVNLIGPGCGYTTPPLVPEDNGSSFASPYVLTAAWVRMLQGLPAASLKQALITASPPVVSVGQRVESGGLFDPALFLLHPGSHLVTPGGAFIALTSLRFSMSYQSDGVGITVRSAPAQDPLHVVTFQACANSTDLCTSVRRWQPDGSVWMTSGPVSSFSFEAVSGQQTLVPGDAAALLKLVRLVTF